MRPNRTRSRCIKINTCTMLLQFARAAPQTTDKTIKFNCCCDCSGWQYYTVNPIFSVWPSPSEINTTTRQSAVAILQSKAYACFIPPGLFELRAKEEQVKADEYREGRESLFCLGSFCGWASTPHTQTANASFSWEQSPKERGDIGLYFSGVNKDTAHYP